MFKKFFKRDRDKTGKLAKIVDRFRSKQSDKDKAQAPKVVFSLPKRRSFRSPLVGNKGYRVRGSGERARKFYRMRLTMAERAGDLTLSRRERAKRRRRRKIAKISRRKNRSRKQCLKRRRRSR